MFITFVQGLFFMFYSCNGHPLRNDYGLGVPPVDVPEPGDVVPGVVVEPGVVLDPGTVDPGVVVVEPGLVVGEVELPGTVEPGYVVLPGTVDCCKAPPVVVEPG